MKITFVATYDVENPRSGGGAVYVQKVAERLAKQHQVAIVSESIEGQKLESTINDVSIVRHRFSGRSPLSRAFAALSRRVRESDLVVESADAGGPWFTLLRKKGILLSFQLWREIFLREVKLPVGWAAYLLEPSLYLPYKHVPTVACSRSTASSLSKVGIHGAKVIPPGVEDRFLAVKCSPEDKSNHPTLVVLGRLKAYKGVQFALLSFRKVLKRFPDARLNVVGEGDFLPALKSLAISLGIGGSVRFLGRLQQEDRIEVLSQAHLLINTSIREGFGINVLEANACYAPCVGWNVLGTRDAIRDGETGILVEPFSVPTLSDKIIGLLLNEEERWRMAKLARGWAQNFPWSSTCERFEAFLGRVA